MRQLRIIGITDETADSKTFTLEPIEGELPYKAGQFLTFVFQLQNKQERRSYSLSSSPEWQEPPAVTVKRLANGAFSRPLLEFAEPGDLLTVAGGASGFFTLPAADEIHRYDKIFFLAAGSGITPAFSLIKSALKQFPGTPLVLVYGNRSRERTIFRGALQQLESTYPQLTIEWLFSSDQDLLRARLNKSLLKEILLKRGPKAPERALAYLCGPFDFMRMAAIVLQTGGVPSENIRREVFTTDVPTTNARPPDTDRHRAEIHFKGRRYDLEVQFPQSILAAAKQQHIDLPYSCEAGRCGSCVATCTKGTVWMKYNEVLTDNEVARGRVLICNGFPVGGDVVIHFDS